MPTINLRVHPSTALLPREQQLAWAIAQFATGSPRILAEVAEAVGFRAADTLAVALAAIDRAPVPAARQMALAHPRLRGAKVFGFDVGVHAEWAGFANGVAVRNRTKKPW